MCFSPFCLYAQMKIAKKAMPKSTTNKLNEQSERKELVKVREKANFANQK